MQGNISDDRLDTGAGADRIPASEQNAFAPIFSLIATVDSAWWPQGDRRNLLPPQEYRSISSQLSAVAQNIVARPAPIKHYELGPNDEVSKEACVRDVAHPRRTRPTRFRRDNPPSENAISKSHRSLLRPTHFLTISGSMGVARIWFLSYSRELRFGRRVSLFL